MKLAVLRERRRDGDLAEGWVPGPERVAMFATGTPVANSRSPRRGSRPRLLGR